MELMDSTSNINNGITIPKLIEFPEHFVLNTQLYDKQTLKPIPAKFYVNNDLNVPFMTLYTSIDKTKFYYTGNNSDFDMIQNNNEHNHQNIIQDKNDPNIFYVLQKYNSHDSMRLYKIQYNNNTKQYNILNTFTTGQSGLYHNYKGDIKIIYETDEYFVLSITGQHDINTRYSGFYVGISLLNKKTFGYTLLIERNNSQSLWPFYLLESNNNDIIYVLGRNTDYYTKQITKINITTKTIATIWKDTPTCNKGVICNPVKIGDYYYVLIPYLENTIYTYKIMKISLNTIDDKINTELLNINLNNFILDNSPSANMIYSYEIKYTLRVIKSDNNIYLSCLMHETPNDVAYAYQHKHVLLKFNGASFTVIDVISLTDGCYGSLEYNDSKHQIWYMPNCVLFYAFDKTKEKMICTYRKAGEFMQIGFDSLNRFITQTRDYTIEILTELNACTLNADFDKEIYDKETEKELSTTVSFYGKNFLDEYLETNVKLTLIGPVIFEENGTKELITTTLKTGIKTIPVIIKGYGNIEVIIAQNT